MFESIQQLLIAGTYFLQNIVEFVEPFLKNLDPSLFQSITLGVLAIFIPFAIVFLADILNSKNQKKRSEFERMVLSDEVLGAKKVFWLAIGSIGFFAFFSGTNISTSAKIISVFAVFVFTSIFWSAFKRILRFSEGNKPEFEIPFLKKLSFSKILRYKNSAKAEKMVRAWKSFWSEKSEYNEREFTKIFISHIDDAIKFKKLELAIQLSQNYVNNIEKRDPFSIGNEIFPKVFEWNENFWNGQQSWIKSRSLEKRIQNFFSQKYFPTFRKWALSIFKIFGSNRDIFWNWMYFGGEFFQAVIKSLLKDEHGPYQLFTCFKQHIEDCENKLNKTENEIKKKNISTIIEKLFASFCPTFFNEIDHSPSKFDIWEHYFPKKWKISMSNIEDRNSRIILGIFLQWSEDRIFKSNADFDKDLTEVINGIFPNVQSSLFTAFLMLLSPTEIKYALEKKPNFHISNFSVFQSGSEDELAEMMKEKEISQKEETIQIIVNFFHFWQPLKIYTEDLTEEESQNWISFSEENRKSIIKKIRKEKLEKIRNEIESTEIKEICKDSEQKEGYRKDFFELVGLLLLEIEK